MPIQITAFDSLQDGLTSAIGEVTSVVSEHPIGVAAGVVGAGVIGAGIVALASSGSKKKTKRKAGKKIKHTSRGWKQDRKRRSKQKWEVAYRRRKKKHSKSRRKKGTHYTKKGQPYIILASGKARFIKKTKRRHKK